MLMQIHPKVATKQAVGGSLKGHAVDMVRLLGPSAMVHDIVAKLEKVYGCVADSDVQLQHFF